METPQEQQDAHYKSQGFHLEDDYEYPDITDDELQSLQRLAAVAGKERGNKYLESLAKAQCLRDFGFAFSNNLGVIREFALRQNQASPNADLPDKKLLGKLEKRVTFQDAISFIINDSGEIREDKAYEPDGTTIKPGWVRLYAK